MANYFASEKFPAREACKKRLSNILAKREEGYYENGILKLFL